MLFYTSIFLLCGFIAFIASKSRIKQNKDKVKMSYVILLTGIFLIVSGWRVNTGTDFINYYNFYNLMYVHPHYLWTGRFEFGFKLLVFMLTKLSRDPQLLFIACAAITHLLIVKSLRDYFPNNFVWSITIYMSMFFFPSMNLVRQYLALAIAIYAIRFLIDKKIFKFIIGIGIASLLHITCAIFLVLLLVVSNMNNYFKIVIGGVILYALNRIASSGILQESYSYLFDGRSVNYTKLIVPIIFLIVLFVEFKKIKPLLSNNIWKISVFGLLFVILFRGLGTISLFITRLSDYFMYSYVGIISLLHNNQLSRKTFYNIIFISLMLFWFFDMINSNNGDILPYRNKLLNLYIPY